MMDKVTILIAEDDTGHARLIEKNLGRASLRNSIRLFEDGQEVLDFLFRRGPGPYRESGTAYLLMLDIRMPKVDGVEVLRQVKQDAALRKLPVVMLTTTDDPRAIERCHELGCNNDIVIAAGSGEEATDRVRRDRVDLLLLDLRLPDTEGGAFIQRMAEAGCSSPFIVITGRGDERVAVDLMKRGALDYLPKDANFIELVPSVVRRGLEQLERGRRLDQAETDWRESEARYRQLVEALPIAVYTCDTDGRITLFNRAAAALWGREPVIGRDRSCEGHRIFDSTGAPLTPGDRRSRPAHEALPGGNQRCRLGDPSACRGRHGNGLHEEIQRIGTGAESA